MAQVSSDAVRELGAAPTAEELIRLVFYYPTYGWEHRRALLQGYFRDPPQTVEQLVRDKLKAKNIIYEECSGRSLGAHSRWVNKKIRKTIVRLLYLRYRLDENQSQREAHQRLLKRYGAPDGKGTLDAGQSAVRKMTRCKTLDG